jgi:hypothetical protein
MGKNKGPKLNKHGDYKGRRPASERAQQAVDPTYPVKPSCDSHRRHGQVCNCP